MDPVVVVGLVLAAGFWILTQANIIWTKNALSKRVIAASAETKQDAIDTVRAMEGRIDAQIKAVDERLAALPDPEDFEPDYDAMAAAVGPIVTKHMEMAFRQVEAQQAKRTGQFLKEMGVDEQLAGLEEHVREEALAAAGPQAQAMMEILNMKVPKKASIIEKLVMQSAKAQAAQMLQGQMPSIGQVESTAPSPRSGIGVR